MRNLILNGDLRRLFQGAAGVALGGLMLGAVMHPTLKGPDELGGPQMLMGVSGARSAYAPDLAATWTSYVGQVPDDVVGTDWAHPPQAQIAYADGPVVVADIADEPQADTGQAVEAVQTTWREPAREPPRYPSMSGAPPNDSDLPPPPEPPDDEDGPIAG
jgi:hypothetical protein